MDRASHRSVVSSRPKMSVRKNWRVSRARPTSAELLSFLPGRQQRKKTRDAAGHEKRRLLLGFPPPLPRTWCTKLATAGHSSHGAPTAVIPHLWATNNSSAAAAHLCLELGVEGVGAAGEELPDGDPPLRPARVGVEAVLALAGVRADVLPREALAVTEEGPASRRRDKTAASHQRG